MTKSTLAGIVVGGIFAAAIVYGAVAMAFEVGGFVLLAAAVDGLFAALCIAGLIAANFALASQDEQKTPGIEADAAKAA
jgi:hypothetical protein